MAELAAAALEARPPSAYDDVDVGRLRAEVAELAAWRRGLEQSTPPEKQQVGACAWGCERESGS